MQKPIQLDPSQDSSDLVPRTFDVYFLETDTPEELLVKVVRSILERLPEDQRDVLELLMSGILVPDDGGDQGYRRAARLLEVDHKTVKRRLAKALAVVERELNAVPDWVLQMLAGRVPLERDIETQSVDMFEPMRRAIASMRGEQ